MAVSKNCSVMLPAPIAGWQNYPVNLAAYDPIATSGTEIKQRLRALSSKIFKGNINVRIVDIVEVNGTLKCSHTLFGEAEALGALLSKNANPRTRIISIHQTTSISPLQISEQLMLQILTRYQVVPEFLEVLFSFGSEPHVAESGHTNLAVVGAPEGIRHTAYQFRYAEENYRSVDLPWSVRQTGVYHQQSSGFDLWILLNPRRGSTIEKQLETLESPSHSTALKKVVEDSGRLHVLIFESCIRNWRWYLRDLGAKFEKKNEPAFVFDLKDASPAVLSFEAVRALRNLHDEVIALGAHCNGDLKVIRGLQTIISSTGKGYILQPYSDLLQGYNESLAVLQSRIQNVIDLTAYALDTKVNEHILTLTNESVNDSATVKLITVLSLLYLPGSFVGTVFGTNFFWYNSETNRVRIGEDFWIYVITWITLTGLTVSVYMYLYRHKKHRAKDRWPTVKRSKWA